VSPAPSGSPVPGASSSAAPIVAVLPRNTVIGLLSEVLARYKGK